MADDILEWGNPLQNVFKEILYPRTVLGLQCDGLHISAVQVSNPGGTPGVDRISRQKVENTADLPDALKGFWERENFSPEAVVSSIPTSLAVVREMDLPVKNAKKLDRIVKYQMEPFSPFPIEEMVVDFFPPDPDYPVMLTGVAKTDLGEHLEMLSAAGIVPDRVTLDDAALFFLYLRTHVEKSDSPVAVLHLKREETTVMVIEGKRLSYMRCLPGDAKDLQPLKETLGLYSIKYPDAMIGEILATGAPAADASVLQRIEKETNIRTTLWQPFDQVKTEENQVVSPKLQATLAVALGLALAPAEASPHLPDLRKEEFRLKTTFNLKHMAVYALVAILTLTGLFTFDAYRRLSTVRTAYETVNRQMNRVLVDTFPDIRTVIKGRELEQMRQRIASAKTSYRWLEDITLSDPVLEILLVLTRTLAGYPGVKIDNISIEGNRVLLDGRASSFKTVDDLKGRLETTNYFQATRLTGAKMDSQYEMIRFNFHLEKKGDTQKT